MLQLVNIFISLNTVSVTRQVTKINLNKRIMVKAVNVFIAAEKIPELEVRAILSKPRKVPQRRMSTGRSRSTKNVGARRASFQGTNLVIVIEHNLQMCFFFL